MANGTVTTEAMARPVAAPKRELGDRVEGWAVYQRLRSAGAVGELLVKTIRVAVRPPYPWIADAVVQFSLYARRAIVPLALSIAAYSVGYAVFFFLTLVDALGAIDRQPGAIFTILTREIAVWVSTMVFAGVAGSAVCADLGARKTREELDAMAVLGVDRIRALVVPRVVAMTLLAPLIGLLGLFAAMIATFLTTPGLSGISHALFLDSVAHSVIPADLIAFQLKLLIVGLFVGIVSCHKGLSSGGGAEGVGRAVNETVVITFFGIWLINSLFNVTYLTLFPDSSILRG